MMRLTYVPPSVHAVAAACGVLKTTTSCRDGFEKARQIRQASTRSLELPRHPGPGLAQLRYGSIDDVGIRYGYTTQCLIASTMRIAPTIVRTQSSVTRTPRDSPGNSRPSGSCEWRAAAGAASSVGYAE